MARVKTVELIGGPLDGKVIPVKCDDSALPALLFVERYEVALVGASVCDAHIEGFYGTESENCARYRRVHGGNPWAARYVWRP